MDAYSPFYEKSLQTLKESPVFQNIDENIIKDILKDMNLITWKKGSEIPYERNIKYFHFILSGRVMVYKINPKNGKSVTIFLLKKGDMFDLISLLDGKEHEVLIQAIDNIEVLEIKIENMRKYLLKYPVLNKNFYPYLGEMMRRLEDLSTNLALTDTFVRLGKLILNYVDEKCKDKNGHYKVDLIHDLSHDKLAQMIGTVRNVLSRHLQTLKDENIIYFKRGHLSIKDLESLKKKCENFI